MNCEKGAQGYIYGEVGYVWLAYSHQFAQHRYEPGSYNLMMSSFKLVPPVVTIHLQPRYLLSSIQMWLVWRANSLVGTMINAEIQRFHMWKLIRDTKCYQRKRKCAGPTSNCICSAQGLTSISHVYARENLGLHNITWASKELFLTSPGVW